MNQLLFLFIFNYKVLTYNTYLQTIYGTYATDKTILYLQNNTDWFTVWDTYATNNTILYLQYDLHTLQKPEKKGGSMINFS